MASISETTPPAVEPVTLAEAKAVLRVVHTAEDAEITQGIVAVRRAAERYQNRQYITASWTLKVDYGFPPLARIPWPIVLQDSAVPLLPGPVQSITSISYVDGDGNTQVLAASEYVLQGKSRIPYVAPAYGKVWPTTRYQDAAITIVFAAGYGAAATDVPAEIIRAIYQGIVHYYVMRGDNESMLGTMVLPAAALALLATDRIMLP